MKLSLRFERKICSMTFWVQISGFTLKISLCIDMSDWDCSYDFDEKFEQEYVIPSQVLFSLLMLNPLRP